MVPVLAIPAAFQFWDPGIRIPKLHFYEFVEKINDVLKNNIFQLNFLEIRSNFGNFWQEQFRRKLALSQDFQSRDSN
jgi:hypothetical protein